MISNIINIISSGPSEFFIYIVTFIVLVAALIFCSAIFSMLEKSSLEKERDCMDNKERLERLEKLAEEKEQKDIESRKVLIAELDALCEGKSVLIETYRLSKYAGLDVSAYERKENSSTYLFFDGETNQLMISRQDSAEKTYFPQTANCPYVHKASVQQLCELVNLYKSFEQGFYNSIDEQLADAD